jgi:Superfamily II DNA and RNA helicases
MQIAKKHMAEYDVFKVNQGELTVRQTDQIYFEVAEADKLEALCRIIDIENEFYGLVFVRTKIDVDSVANQLIDRGYDADALHGDMSQGFREKILAKFKKRLVTILVATDVAARGIDVHDLTHVINYAIPHDPESYVHRIGRTGRAGKEGNAITFITPEEYRRLNYIRKGAKTDIRKGQLPKVGDVIKVKKQRIIAQLKEIVEAHLQRDYCEMSRELLADNNPEEILAALLQYSFEGELDAKSYADIDETVVDKKGKTRLFVRQGTQNGLNAKKLADIIRDKCGVRNDRIRDIQILDRFSFVTLPFHEAEMVLAYFKQGNRGSELFITKAKEDRAKRRSR